MEGIVFTIEWQVKSYIRQLIFIYMLIAGSAIIARGSDASHVASDRIDTVTLTREYFEPRDFIRHDKFLPVDLGLALSGGGARGLAQIGILKAMDDAGLKISYITGTSIGSIIGGLYASGFSGVEIEDLLGEVDFGSLFSDAPQRRSLLFTQRTERDQYLFSIRFQGLKPYIPQALAAGQQLTALLTDLTIRAYYRCGGDFDRLPIPFRVAATDIGTGEAVSLSGGSLADAMRASMAFPLAFTAVELDGRHLMDGGIVNPVPVASCREMGAGFVIAVNTVSPLLPVEQINGPIDIANQITTIMSQDALKRQLAQADYVAKPPLEGVEAYNFKMQDSLVSLGYQYGKKIVADIEKELRASIEENASRLESIEVADGSSELKEIKARFPLKRGEPVTAGILRKALLFCDREGKFQTLRAVTTRRGDAVSIRLEGRLNHTYDKIRYRFVGNISVPDKILREFFPARKAAVLSMAAIKSAADSIVSLYHKSGSDLAHLRSIEYNHEAKQITVTFDEGRLQQIGIRGSKRTRDWIIKANFPLAAGDPFDIKKAEKGLSNIFGTGFFERVSFDLEPIEEGAYLTIIVKEKKFSQIRIGGHWDDEYQSEMFVELLDDNIFGAGIQALMHARFSSRKNQYIFSLKADRLSRTLLTARTAVYFSRLRRRLFDPEGGPDGYRVEDRLGWSILVGQQIARLGAIQFEYRLEEIETLMTETDEVEDQVLSVFAIKSRVDTFDKYPYPHKGHRQSLNVEFSGKWLGGTYDEYTKLHGFIEQYWPIGNYLNFHPRISAGLSTANLPAIEKYFIGGFYDFSGYRTEQLGGDKFFVISTQLRAKLPYRIYLLANFDWGNVFDEYEEIKMRDFRRGYGASLSIDTPLGPFDFGFGRSEGHSYRLYLNLGLRF